MYRNLSAEMGSSKSNTFIVLVITLYVYDFLRCSESLNFALPQRLVKRLTETSLSRAKIDIHQLYKAIFELCAQRREHFVHQKITLLTKVPKGRGEKCVRCEWSSDSLRLLPLSKKRLGLLLTTGQPTDLRKALKRLQDRFVIRCQLFSSDRQAAA